MTFICNNPSEEADINFVLLHGLDGNVDSFTNKESDKSLQDCIRSSFPRSKIITYQYPNNSLKLISSKYPLPISDRAENFVCSLINELDNDKSIHFVCHSMGGLIVKEALITASEAVDSYIDTIYHRTRSVTFYSTPHTGSSLANVLRVLSQDILLYSVVKTLNNNNPYLLNLKQQFNDLIINGKNQDIKILSIVETQPMSMLQTKVVERESAVCGFDKKREQQRLLDHDHVQICKPEHIKDERFKCLAYFVAQIMRIIKRTGGRNNDDEKKADELSETDILFIDPNHIDSDDCEVAIRAFSKKKDVASLTNLLGALFKDKAQTYVQQRLNELLKDNLMKQNTKILNSLLKTREFMQHVEESKIHESIQLSNEYWNLLKVSKRVITTKKSQINKLGNVAKRWRVILQKRIKYENEEGAAPSKQDAKYMEYVQKSLCKYFESGDKDTEQMALKWAKLTEKLAEQYLWWKDKYELFKSWKQKQWEQMKEKAKSVWGWLEMIGSAVKWLGAAVAVGAAVAAIFLSGGTALIVMGVAAGASGVGYIGQNLARSKRKEWDKQQRKVSIVENGVKQVMDAFNTMKKDGSAMDRLFHDFGTLLCQPKDDANEIAEECDQEGELNWYMMSDNVGDIITSLEALKNVCIDLIKQIDISQKNFYSED